MIRWPGRAAETFPRQAASGRVVTPLARAGHECRSWWGLQEIPVVVDMERPAAG